MTHIMVALFEDSKAAGGAVGELKNRGYARDISVIAKAPGTGAIHLYQIKEHDVEMEDTELGADWGLVGGIVGGLTAVLNPLTAAPAVVAAFAVAMGVAGAAIGAATGEYMGALSGAGLPPERAKLFADRIRAGEVVVSVADTKGADDQVRETFVLYGGKHIHTLENPR